MDALLRLVRELAYRYGIAPFNIITHAMVAVPPGRKVDPIGFPLADFVKRVYTRRYKPRDRRKWGRSKMI